MVFNDTPLTYAHWQITSLITCNIIIYIEGINGIQ